MKIPAQGEFLIFDGAMGTMLQRAGLKAGTLPELLNIDDPELIVSIHRQYVEAGAMAITTNTFGANAHKLAGAGDVAVLNREAVLLAKRAGAKYVALDVGPTGALLKPMGDMSFDEAYDIFFEQISAGASAGADLVLIETMSDLLEAKAALLAAKECCSLPVFVTMTYQKNGKTFLGTDPVAATVTLCSLGADAVGLNCSLEPSEILPVVETIVKYASVPVIAQANAGLPGVVNGETVWGVSAKQYASDAERLLDAGVSIIGGCCGTTPEYIREIAKLTATRKPTEREMPCFTAVTSARNAVILDDATAVIGERINPTGKKRLKQALRENDMDYIVDEALSQQQYGADILDVNAGLPDIDEREMLVRLVCELQSVTTLPLQLDSSDAAALEAAVRVYNGKPIINSVNGKKESMDTILPIVKKYGTAVVALTLDENGIPSTAQGRLEIARKIIDRAESEGIRRENILVDCLVLTASTNQREVMETIKAVRLVKSTLGVKTVLGVSNVSFGLPNRELLNSSFLAAAFGAGLDMPILNPLSKAYMDVVAAFKVLNCEDTDCAKYIEKNSEKTEAPCAAAEAGDIREIIMSGRKSAAEPAVRELLKTHSEMDIINELLIPALDEVGKNFETGRFFLPQLLASAETAKCGFNVLRESGGSHSMENRGKVLLATVKGDIHDIGKNIVRMLLQNYGYEVIDLGKDVEPELIVKTALEQNIKLVGLSALMTTTVSSMTKTISLLRQSGIDCKIMVGGAVLNEEYASITGADYYAKDAARSASIAQEVFGQ